MSSKVAESGKDGSSSETSQKSPGKSPSSSIASPPSKLSAIAKFLKSPRKQVKISEQNEQTKSKPSQSNKKGKMKNIKNPVKSGPIFGSKTTRRESSKKHASSAENEEIFPGQKRDFLEKKKGKCFSRDIVQGEASVPCGGSGLSTDQNVVNTTADNQGDSKKSMVQTSLSTTKELVEVLRSPEPPVQKKKGRKARSKKKEKADEKQTRITSIFPLRKSTRRTKAQQEKDEQERITKIILAKKFEGLEVRTTEGKGRGVFASRDFERNEFVCEYAGELITYDEAKKRETHYNEDKNIGCYMYYLQFNNKKYCIDATAEDRTLGRLINHSRKGNCKTKIHGIDNLPHLIFMTTRHIKIGEELLYDYGERSKDIIQSHPWLES